LREVLAHTVAALDRPGPRTPLATERTQLPEPLGAVRELLARQDPALGVHDDHGVEPLVRIDADHHLAHCFLLAPCCQKRREGSATSSLAFPSRATPHRSMLDGQRSIREPHPNRVGSLLASQTVEHLSSRLAGPEPARYPNK
jgi:hypothetical protein